MRLAALLAALLMAMPAAADAVRLAPAGPPAEAASGGAITGPTPPEDVITPARQRAAHGVDAMVGAMATSRGERLVCAPLVDPPSRFPA